MFNCEAVQRSIFCVLKGCLVLWSGAMTLAFAGADAFDMNEVAPGVFVHYGLHEDLSKANQGDIANIGFIAGDKSVLVIDPGGSPAVARAMQLWIKNEIGLPVSHVVLTHAHPDHILGSAVFANADDNQDIEVLAHERYPAAMAQREDFYLERFRELFDDSDLPELILSNRLVQFDQPAIVDIGNRRLTITAHATGHTDHDLSVFDSQTNTLWASDLLFAQRIPSLDGSLTGWLAVMDQLAEYAPVLVVPGHGAVDNWEDIAPAQRRYLNQLLDETRHSISVNTPLSVAVDSVGQSAKGDWLLFDLHHKGNVTKAYTELEWE